MGTRIDDLPIELDQGDLQTRYIEHADMAIRHARIPAGTGMAPVLVGLGLTVDRVEFLRRTIRVDRQLVTMPNALPYLAPCKTPSSVRTIPHLT